VVDERENCQDKFRKNFLIVRGDHLDRHGLRAAAMTPHRRCGAIMTVVSSARHRVSFHA
jgi:hypothetical protein